jgi:SnoaL-like domain
MVRRILLACTIAVLASGSAAVAQGVSGEERLKVTHQTLLSAITSGNPAMLESVIHRSGLGFFRESQMIVQLGGSYGPKEAIPDVLADLGRFTMAAYDTVYRVAGSTGVVGMAMNFQPKKGEKGPPRFIRSTWVYADVDGAWRLLSWHSSDIPLKK